jgi:hypothetical protein
MEGIVTTNLLLGIMAAVSVLQLCSSGVGIARSSSIVASRISQSSSRAAPTMARVNAIPDDGKDVTASKKKLIGRPRHPRHDGSRGRHGGSVRSNARRRRARSGFVRGLRVVIEGYCTLARGQNPRRRRRQGNVIRFGRRGAWTTDTICSAVAVAGAP